MESKGFVKYQIVLGLLGLSWAGPASAREDVVPGSLYTSARGAAMGDSFIGFAEDPMDALFYNPAGIGKTREFQIDLLNFEVGGNQDFLTQMGTSSYKVLSLSSYASHIETNPGTFPGINITLAPSFGFRGFAAGLLFERSVAAYYQGGAIKYRVRQDLVPAVGGAIRLASGVLRIGYTLELVNTSEGYVTVPASSALNYENKLNAGKGISNNVGLALTLPYDYLPALNLVARNIGGVKYSGVPIMNYSINSPGSPPVIRPSYDVSLSAQPKIGFGGAMNMSAELRDATDSSSMSILGRAALGFEYNFRSLVMLRWGINDGYPSAGFGMETRSSKFGFTWYSQETGSTFRSQRDVRYMFQLSSAVF